jgi:hypothetical protein
MRQFGKKLSKDVKISLAPRLLVDINSSGAFLLAKQDASDAGSLRIPLHAEAYLPSMNFIHAFFSHDIEHRIVYDERNKLHAIHLSTPIGELMSISAQEPKVPEVYQTIAMQFMCDASTKLGEFYRSLTEENKTVFMSALDSAGRHLSTFLTKALEVSEHIGEIGPVHHAIATTARVASFGLYGARAKEARRAIVGNYLGWSFLENRARSFAGLMSTECEEFKYLGEPEAQEGNQTIVDFYEDIAGRAKVQKGRAEKIIGANKNYFAFHGVSLNSSAVGDLEKSLLGRRWGISGKVLGIDEPSQK